MAEKILINLKETPYLKLDINLEINKHDFIALVGQSGSGKTTILRAIAGLERAIGEIVVFNKTYLNSKISLPPQKREVGFVFQDYALFENMTVLKNLLYVKKDLSLANRLLKLTELEEFKNRYPAYLSGGQKQRVALCRALMREPKILLLDEPLSALDWKIRQKLQFEIIKLHKEFNLTTIMVSHDMSEAYKMANRVIELQNGKVINDTILKEYHKPLNEFKISAEVVKVYEDRALVVANSQLYEVKKENLTVGQIVKLTISQKCIAIIDN